MYNNIVIFGSTGAVGNALITQFADMYPESDIHAVGRSTPSEQNNQVTYHTIDYSEDALSSLAKDISKPIDLLIIAIGMLHNESISPEKAISALNADSMLAVYHTNTVIPALITKHFAPLMQKGERSILGIISARVGSISDNALGGWHSYRASKAALNMLIKNFSIELKRTHPEMIVMGLHPGTVDSALSAPYNTHVDPNKLFSPEKAAGYLIDVITNASHEQSGHLIAWDGTTIPE